MQSLYLDILYIQLIFPLSLLGVLSQPRIRISQMIGYYPAFLSGTLDLTDGDRSSIFRCYGKETKKQPAITNTKFFNLLSELHTNMIEQYLEFSPDFFYIVFTAAMQSEFQKPPPSEERIQRDRRLMPTMTEIFMPLHRLARKPAI